jgi:hypothetical protein
VTHANLSFEKWWCCLNPRERTIQLEILPSFLTPEMWVEEAQLVVFWVAFGLDAFGDMYNTFLASYGLTYEVVEVSPEDFRAVYRMDEEYWGNLYLFVTTIEPFCMTPCRLLTYSI